MRISLLAVALFTLLACKKTHKDPGNKANSAVVLKVVFKPEVILRAEASTTSAKLASLPYGTNLQVLDANGPELQFLGVTARWTKVMHGSQTGWVFGAFLGELSEQQVYTAQGGKLVAGGANGAIMQVGSQEWTHCALGMTAHAGTCKGEPTLFDAGESDKACAALKLEGRPWRLPTSVELKAARNSPIGLHAPASGSFLSSTRATSGNEDGWIIVNLPDWREEMTFVKPSYALCVTSQK